MDRELDEVRTLEAEIAALTRACEEPPAPGGDIAGVQKSFQEIFQSGSEGSESSKDLRSTGNAGKLESELLFLSTLTGISIRSYSKKTENQTSTEGTEKDTKKVLQRHRLAGTCRMITFQLEFQVLEVQNKENLSSVITDLNIIMEPTTYSELSKFVSRAEERRDLFMFFRSLHYFVEWCEHRKRTFKHFKDKYPAAVRLPEGPVSSYMEVQSARRPGLQVLVVWRIQVDEGGAVLPTLDLLPQVPRAAQGRHEGLADAATGFRALLGALGIEAALDGLIRALCAGGGARSPRHAQSLLPA